MVPLDDPILISGWNPPEDDWRWTDGAAEISVAGMRDVSFTQAMDGTYWVDLDRPAPCLPGLPIPRVAAVGQVSVRTA